jgi:cytoskeletal protein CcmA (bactofilin family)
MDRVTSVLGPATIVKGRLSGSGGVRIEGSFEGDISLDGLLVIGENGKVTSDQITATVVVIAGAVKGNITAEKVEIRASGRVWGDITTSAFATHEGAFLRGQVRMEEHVELQFIDEEALEVEEPVEEERPEEQVETAISTLAGIEASVPSEASGGGNGPASEIRAEAQGASPNLGTALSENQLASTGYGKEFQGEASGVTEPESETVKPVKRGKKN